ncbi:MAG: HDOD domain-containing protein [Acidobacteriaceae bacterium]
MKRVLFVDDDRNVLDGIRHIMRSSGNEWEAQFVESGEAALGIFMQQPFDVVVSDLRMPGMDGAELLDHIRIKYPSAARIVLSGYSEVALTARALSASHQVLSKPCHQDRLRETLQRVSDLQDLLCTPALRDVIGKIGDLPSLSTAYAALSRALDDPTISISALTKTIERDIAMSAKVLRVVNCGFFPMARSATSLEQAVSYLGLNTIRSLLLYSESLSLFTPDRCVPEAFLSNMQWRASRTAMIVSSLPLANDPRERTILAALLCELGLLVLASSMPKDLCAILRRQDDLGCSLVDAEEQQMGVSHAEIGAYLLGLWGLNNSIVEAIAHQHRPSRIKHDAFDCSLALYLAHLLEQEISTHPEDENGEQMQEADQIELQALGLLDDYPLFHHRATSALQFAQNN